MTNGNYLIIIAALIGLFVFRECEHKAEKDQLKDSIVSVKDFMEKELDSYFAGKDIEVQDSVVAHQNLVSSIDEVLADKYIHDTTYLASNTDEFIHRDTVREYFIPKGTKASHEDLWYDIDITLNDSLQIDSLKVRDKIDAVLAWRKPDKSFKWLRKREPIVTVQSYNPYTTIGHVNNLVVKDEKSKFVKVLTSKPMMFLYGVGAAFTYQGFK